MEKKVVRVGIIVGLACFSVGVIIGKLLGWKSALDFFDVDPNDCPDDCQGCSGDCYNCDGCFEVDDTETAEIEPETGDITDVDSEVASTDN